MYTCETGDYIEYKSFEELEKEIGAIPFNEKLKNKVIKASISDFTNKLWLTVQHGRNDVTDYSLDNIYGSWGNLTRYR